ncbi:primosomal protein N' [Desulfobacula sp.]|uniref:replication restart helicase PriA n=1 Tax=Desulfobacula sp. TaxID=2593537 RepID=UPI00262F0523|nr:primosomal protein N' [Desulfobacula sp.]
MIQTPYISVAVSLPVMKSYTYRVPDHLQDFCSPGMRVLVPFKNRRVTGYILSGQKSCGGFTAKKIFDVLDDYPLFPESEISFFKWISDYYIHPLGDVIKAALPSGLDRHDVSCVFVTQHGQDSLNAGRLTPGEEQVIEFILQRQSCTLKQLEKNSANTTINALVRRMEKEDLITISAVLKKDGAKIKKEKFILPGDEPKTIIPMSKKRKKLLLLVKEAKEISLTGLKAHIPTAPALIKPLAQAGYIKIIQRQVFRDPLGDPVEPDTPPRLTLEQEAVVKRVQENFRQGFSPYLLSGITGSGKTEVYMRLVRDVVEKGKSAIVLVPEISLISQTERRFRARFGEKIAVIHSSLTKGELIDQWRKIALKKVSIVIGARSAVFAPFENIGIIVVDEEHDTSYKQETGLRYNARDIAVVRGKMNGCPVILGSATPSLQSYQNVVMKRFEELKLKTRVNRHPLPEITLVDLKKHKDVRGYDRIITPELSKEIRTCLDKGNQALIFLNRRGFATSPVCRDCGKSLSCKYCDITMTLHKGHNEYRCHLCGYGRPTNVKCPECGSSKIKPLGFGTEKVESMLKDLFPDARLVRMDQDSTSRKGATIKILKSIRNRNVDIIVGTQMLAKGHDFPAITLVGVVCADLSLSLPDFRAGERTFQLLAQVAGRAGRGDTKGKVIMQTYNPDHFIIEAAKKQDFLEFFQNEAPFRKALLYPPFSRMIQLKISGTSFVKVKVYAANVAAVLKALLENEENHKNMIRILGPIEAPIQKISSRFRWQILVKSPSSALVNGLVKSLMDHPKITPKSGLRLIVDVDPYFLM